MFGERFTRIFGPLVLVVFLAAACGGQGQSGASNEGTGKTTSTTATMAGGGSSGGTTGMTSGATAGENAYNPDARIGPKEITNMTPADGKKPDEPQPLPKNPPEGVKTYPATTSNIVEGKIKYKRNPPTNGDHSSMWQNCGFYSQPIQKETVVHSLDHGVVWITYRPGLSQGQIDALRPYGGEKYVIVSPYPGLPAPVVATSWRNQLYLNGAEDPRLRKFVNEFRISEISPLSGNRCVGGVGKPDA